MADMIFDEQDSLAPPGGSGAQEAEYGPEVPRSGFQEGKSVQEGGHDEDVRAAFHLLFEAIDGVIEEVKEAAQEALAAQDFERARQAIDLGEQVKHYKIKLEALRKEWEKLRVSHRRTRRSPSKPATAERLERGLRTPQDAFRRPILEALVELGGAAPVGAVLERVERMMGPRLTPYDRSSLPSNPRELRWRNTAMWCRKMMVGNGLLKNDSPRGIWEITDAGRAWLEREQGT